MQKDELIDSLYKIMCTATSSAIDSSVTNNDYFKRRVLGFRAEIEFEAYVDSKLSNANFLEGGQFISKKLDGSTDRKNIFLYTTVSEDDPKDYTAIYATIAAWDEVDKLIFIRSHPDGWSKQDFEAKDDNKKPFSTSVLKPQYSFYIFDKTALAFTEVKNDFSVVLDYFEEPARQPSRFHLRKREQFDYFKDYDISVLRKIYANRYFLDLILRKAHGKQILDLDGFVVSDGNIKLIEVKEKAPIKPKKKSDTENQAMWQYGWDSRRILWYLYVLNNTQMSVLYCIREIDDRFKRNFIQWDVITLDDFLKVTSWSSSRGGGGGESTVLAPYNFFSPIDQHLK